MDSVRRATAFRDGNVMSSNVTEYYSTAHQQRFTIEYRWPYSYSVKLVGRGRISVIPCLPEETEEALLRVAEKALEELVDYYSKSAENLRHIEEINDRYYQKNSSESASGSPVGTYLSEEYRKRIKQKSTRKPKED